MSILRLLIILVLLSFPSWGQPPEVKSAYQAIPHRYTPFHANKAKMQAAEKAYLEANFKLVNQAVVARVQAMQRKDYAAYDGKANSLLRQLQGQRPPKNLAQYHNLVIGAIKDQRGYFKAWRKNPSASFNAGDPKVRAGSAKLRQAYSILMRQYPGQAKQIKEAFFDHLCALDFI